mmetsp:Transcript_936/g.1197  ORF Transcript_936/g.1197 Transcript_936/m.1197 type:complete len:197 (+) Transcript_936:43-633(+)
MKFLLLLALAINIALSVAFPTLRNAIRSQNRLKMANSNELFNRKEFLSSSAAILTIAFLQLPMKAFSEPITTKSGMIIEKLVEGKGAKCEVGDLAAVRFIGKYKDFEFDNLYTADEPLYIRVGGSNLLKGIDEAVLMMRVGDVWELTIPGSLGFGQKGRPPSPGKQRIPPNATLVYKLEIISLPGKEGDIYDTLDD